MHTYVGLLLFAIAQVTHQLCVYGCPRMIPTKAQTPSPTYKPYTFLTYRPLATPTTGKGTQPTDIIKEVFETSNITAEVDFSNETSTTEISVPGKTIQQLTPSVHAIGDRHRYCIPDQSCTMHAQCGLGGCVYRKCRCGCVENGPCSMREHCFGYPCVDTCESITRFPTECNKEDECARGTQCLVGVCVGGGRLNVGMYEGVSCTMFTDQTDCEGIGDVECAIVGDLCIRHFNASHIGRIRNGDICNYGVSSSIGFPTCVSAKGQSVQCGVLDMCRVESHCGSCKCGDAMHN